jgi:RNA-directed DNA polymerase
VMNLTTPDKIRNLQRKLYCKAKAEPTFRFYLLYDKICRGDILLHAYRLARVNAGAPGVDGMMFARIEERGLEAWLAGLRTELVSKTYRPDPVRRVMIPKANGGEHPLGIPTIRDRVIQTAAKIVIEPIFEADFEDNAYGYRPARGAVDAVKEVHRHLCRGYADVVDADLSKYLDVASYYTFSFFERVEEVWSSCRYLNSYAFCPSAGCGDTFHAHVVSYADDFVILSRGRAAEALAWTKAVMTRLGLTINEAKTSLRNARQERFDFLGYSFGAHRFEANGNWYLGASPSKKSVQRLKTRIGDLLVPSNIDPWPEVCDKLNRSLRGWSNYFGYGSRSKAYRGVDQYVFERLRRFLARRHKVQGRGNRRFTFDVIHRELGVLCLQRLPRTVPSWALR